MEWIVTTGKTVAEAVEAALDELGVDEADIEYEVLEESKRGFLSRLGGGTPARIKARVKPLSREKPDRRRRGGGRERDRKPGGEGGARGERSSGDRSGDRSGGERSDDRTGGGGRSGDRPGGGGRSGRSRPSADRPAGRPPVDTAADTGPLDDEADRPTAAGGAGGG